MKAASCVLALLASCSALPSTRGTTVKKPFGTTQTGKAVDIYELTNGRGMRVRVMTYGATVVSIEAPDRRGRMADVILGFDDVAGYESEANQYFGCTAGRVANRIAKGRFEIDGKPYQLAVNNGPNHLHGGVKRSLDKVVWSAMGIAVPHGTGVALRYTSPDGEEGYPGTLDVTVRYVLTDDDVLRISYVARTDKTTPVNLTNHAYWNLAGAGTILDHEIEIHGSRYTPVDATLIPVGRIEPVADTPLDLRSPTRIGLHLGELAKTPAAGYDHNYCVDGWRADRFELRFAARLHDPRSGRSLEIWTTEPGLQFYSGNFLKGDTGKSGRVYPKNGALCLETQHYPDSVNQPSFPTVLLAPGAVYRHVTEHRFSAR